MTGVKTRYRGRSVSVSDACDIFKTGSSSPPVDEQWEGRPVGLHAHCNGQIVWRLPLYADEYK